MGGINTVNATDSNDQAEVVLHGGTDNTKIGNVGDALKVSGAISSLPSLVTVIETEHAKIHSGTMFHYSERFTISTNVTRGYQIVTGDKTLHLRPSVLMEIASKQIITELFETPTGGSIASTLTMVNRNRSSATVFGGTLKVYNTLPTSDGTRLEQVGQGSGSSPAMSVVSASLEWILAANTTYYLKITSLNAANDTTISMDGYEV